MKAESPIFRDEAVLDLNYLPQTLLHRGEETRLLRLLFSYLLTAPGEISQRVIIVGGVGVGKTALAQRFGLDVEGEAGRRGRRVRYLHINCREIRGSLFLALRRAVRTLKPEFPERGYSVDDLLEALLTLLDEEGIHLLLCLDDVEPLIEAEPDALYLLTRVQEERLERPRRLSLIVIAKSLEAFRPLDRSTLSTLQRNVISLHPYTQGQLLDILQSRARDAFQDKAITDEALELISELAAEEGGDARYAIDLLWRAGKYAEAEGSRRVRPRHVREAATTLYRGLRAEELRSLSLHEKLLLIAIARCFRGGTKAYASTGEVEEAYRLVCEEWGQKPRGHTQLWKYLKRLRGLEVVSISLEAARGRTHRIALRVPANALEGEVKRLLEG
ncbi:MAG: hypothetical protein AYL28_000450 [Candidatus Bathyarchaeota archaeon B23]|nr:MAG: hypothetical protein AYL28_000450 [Candidatus Bathyarchaeota archaeon B23]